MANLASEGTATTRCGFAFADPASTDLAAADVVNGLIADESVCAHCEYALRDLPGAGVCPECGRPYTASTTAWPRCPVTILTVVMWVLWFLWPLLAIANVLGLAIISGGIGAPAYAAYWAMLYFIPVVAINAGLRVMYFNMRRSGSSRRRRPLTKTTCDGRWLILLVLAVPLAATAAWLWPIALPSWLAWRHWRAKRAARGMTHVDASRASACANLAASSKKEQRHGISHDCHQCANQRTN